MACNLIRYYSGVTWAAWRWRLKSPTLRLFVEQFVQANNKENMLHYRVFVVEIHRSVMVPLSKSQLCGKRFHVMTSSWKRIIAFQETLSVIFTWCSTKPWQDIILSLTYVCVTKLDNLTILPAESISFMTTSLNGNIFRVTGHLCGEFTGDVPVNSPHKGQWRGALMFSLIWVWING